MRHYPCGGSTAERTLKCRAWHQESAELPKQAASSFADVGTLLHDGMEKIYTDDNFNPPDCVGMTYNAEVCTEELLAEKIMPAVYAMDALFDTYHIDMYECESEVCLIPDLVGSTIDFIGRGTTYAGIAENCAESVFSERNVVLLADYKFGHISVSPIENAQMFHNAACAAHDLETADFFDGVDDIIFAIIQPNGDGDDYEVWETTPEEVNTWRLNYLNAVTESRENKLEELEHSGGAWCKYCPALATCPLKTGLVHQAAQLAPALIANLEDGMAMVEQIEDWCKTVRTTMHAHLEAGTINSENWKLVHKRAKRVWADEDAALTLLRRAKKIKLADGTVTKIKSPAQIEKTCKAVGYDYENFADLVVMHSSGTTLARIDDKRNAVPSAGALAAALETVKT